MLSVHFLLIECAGNEPTPFSLLSESPSDLADEEGADKPLSDSHPSKEVDHV